MYSFYSRRKYGCLNFKFIQSKNFMVIFQNSIYLSFNSLATFSISGINQSAYSVHSPMLFIHISLIKLEFSLSVKKMTWRGVEPESVDW